MGMTATRIRILENQQTGVVSALVQLQRELEFWTAKATKLKLLGEHETYK